MNEPTPAVAAGFRPMRGVAWYKRLQAWALAQRNPGGGALVAARKLALLSPIRGTVLEIGEVLRVLKPGGRFVFMEHVGARRGTFTRWLQRLLCLLWNFVADGCHLDRDTAAAISAAGFRTVVHDHFELPIPLIGAHVAGTAWAP